MQVSLWEKQSFYADSDVIIGGSGLMGLWTALELKRLDPSLQITVLEKNIIPIGASTRNAGFACYGSPSELLYDAEMNGWDSMLALVEMRYKGIQKIRSVFKGKDIGWDACGGYEVFDNNETFTKVAFELENLNQRLSDILDERRTFTWSNDKMSSMNITGFAGMISNKDEAALHSGKLVQSLIQLAGEKGIRILFNTEIRSFEENKKGIQVQTNHQSFQTNKLLLAVNAFASSVHDSTVKPGRGQIILTEPISDLKLKGTFHYDEGFYYFRNIENRILLGGARNADFENETTTRLEVSEIIQSKLENFIADHLLKDVSFKIEYRWSGIMGFTPTKQPELKRISENIFNATACNGMGVALSPVFAEKVAAEILE